MKDCNADSASDSPRPVTDWENKEVNFMASACDSLHERDMTKVRELRGRPRDYIASLPSEPIEATAAIWKLLSDEMDEGLRKAQHALILVEEALRQCDVDGYPSLQDALAWAAMEASDEVGAFIKLRDKAQDICAKVRDA